MDRSLSRLNRFNVVTITNVRAIWPLCMWHGLEQIRKIFSAKALFYYSRTLNKKEKEGATIVMKQITDSQNDLYLRNLFSTQNRLCYFPCLFISHSFISL